MSEDNAEIAKKICQHVEEEVPVQIEKVLNFKDSQISALEKENRELKDGIYRPDIEELKRLTKMLLRSEEKCKRYEEALKVCLDEIQLAGEETFPYAQRLAKEALSKAETHTKHSEEEDNK